jgi:hypothetical protein
MPAGNGVGDHLLFVLDFQEGSLIGEAPFRIKWFTSRQLNTKVTSGATQKYLSRLDNSLDHCFLIECIGLLNTTQVHSSLVPQGPQ